MFIVKGKSDRKKKAKRYLFRLWWTEDCVIGVETASRKEAGAILAEEVNKVCGMFQKIGGFNVHCKRKIR